MDNCNLVCWTHTTTFRLLGNTVDLKGKAPSWQFHDVFVISDSQGRAVGSIFLDKNWHEVLKDQEEFDFMLISRSSSVKGIGSLDEVAFPVTEPWCFVNVMLLIGRWDSAKRAGVGVVHENAWVASDPKPALIRLE